MFDSLLRRRTFYTKCKTSIKRMKVTMEAIKNKRSAVEKYLRKDIEDLLKNGIDYDAFGRAEGLLVEMNVSSCYEQIEQFYLGISLLLSLMDKNSECPVECRENVASLIYAAARFSDLPELRDLRDIFTHKYGTAMGDFVNQEFVEKLRLTPTKEMKMELLQEIAHNSSIDWNSKALEQQLYTPSPLEHDLSHKGSDQMNEVNDGYKLNKSIQIDEMPVCPPSEILHDGLSKEVVNNKPYYARFMFPHYVKPKAGDIAYQKSDQGGSVKSVNKPKQRSFRRRSWRLKSTSSSLTRGADIGSEISMLTEPNMASNGQNGDAPRGDVEANSENTNIHVHPKLPDYDDLAARIAHLSGK